MSNENVKHGFTMYHSHKDIFLISNKAKITDNIAKEFINIIADIKEFPDLIREEALQDKDCVDYVKKRIKRATLIEDPFGVFIKGKDFGYSIPTSEMETSFILYETWYAK